MIRTVIRPTEVFDKAGLLQTVGIRESTVRREIRLGRLKAYRRGGRYFFLGNDVLDWLRGGLVDQPEEPDAGEPGGGE